MDSSNIIKRQEGYILKFEDPDPTSIIFSNCFGDLNQSIKFLRIDYSAIEHIRDQHFNPSLVGQKSQLTPWTFDDGKIIDTTITSKDSIRAMHKLRGDGFDNRFTTWVFSVLSRPNHLEGGNCMFSMLVNLGICPAIINTYNSTECSNTIKMTFRRYRNGDIILTNAFGANSFDQI
jgi:hypothetical protein